MNVYLDDKELFSMPMETEISFHYAKTKIGAYEEQIMKNFGCKISWSTEFGMEYVDDMRRRRLLKWKSL